MVDCLDDRRPLDIPKNSAECLAAYPDLPLHAPTVRRFDPGAGIVRPKNAAARARAAADRHEILLEHALMVRRETGKAVPARLANELEQARHEMERPRFDSAHDYLAYAADCFGRGRLPYPPETSEEYRLLANEFPSQTRLHFYRSPADLQEMGLPSYLLDVIEPFGELWRERLLKTVEIDPVFAKALVVLLREAARS